MVLRIYRIMERKLKRMVGSSRRSFSASASNAGREAAPTAPVAELERLRRRITLLEAECARRAASPRCEYGYIFKSLVEASGQGIAVSDAGGMLVYANAAFLSLAGASRCEIVGRRLVDYLESTSPSGQGAVAGECGVCARYETAVLRPEGDNCAVTVVVGPVFTEEGEFAGQLWELFASNSLCKSEALRRLTAPEI